MFRLVESIKYLDGKIYNLEYHNSRFNRSRKEIFGIQDEISLENAIKPPVDTKTGLYKLRVIYSDKIEEIEFIPYTLRKIENVKLIFNDEIDYTYKYLDKNSFDNLLVQKGSCDDIIIVKKGFVTDASFANLVFFDGADYHTPSSPLLRGTKREELLDKKVIFEKVITPNDLHNYKKVYFINAMIDLFQSGIGINNIRE